MKPVKIHAYLTKGTSINPLTYDLSHCMSLTFQHPIIIEWTLIVLILQPWVQSHIVCPSLTLSLSGIFVGAITVMDWACTRKWKGASTGIIIGAMCAGKKSALCSVFPCSLFVSFRYHFADCVIRHEDVTGNGSYNGAMHAQSCWFMEIETGFNSRPWLYSRKYSTCIWWVRVTASRSKSLGFDSHHQCYFLRQRTHFTLHHYLPHYIMPLNPQVDSLLFAASVAAPLQLYQEDPVTNHWVKQPPLTCSCFNNTPLLNCYLDTCLVTMVMICVGFHPTCYCSWCWNLKPGSIQDTSLLLIQPLSLLSNSKYFEQNVCMTETKYNFRIHSRHLTVQTQPQSCWSDCDAVYKQLRDWG